jgi:hypothetical protein
MKVKPNAASAASCMLQPGKVFYIDVYACVDCGYFEEYLAMNDSAMEKLKTNWKKV